MDVEEKYAPRAFFVKLADFTQPDLTTFLKKHSIEANEDGYYPVFAIMKALNGERKSRRHNSDNISLETDLKFEKVQSERIKNQQRLGKLISRDAAKERVRTTFLAVANKVRYSIKSLTPKLIQYCWAVKNGEIVEPNAREIEGMLTDDYNDSIEMLSKEAANVSWEQDGIEDKLGRTELADDSGEDLSPGSGEEDTSTVEE